MFPEMPSLAIKERCFVLKKKAVAMEALMPILQMQMENGGQAFLTVTGSSMLPMLKPLRDRVWLVDRRDQLHQGDVILYRRNNGQYVLHRIIQLSKQIVCCGDNQWQRETIQDTQIIASVCAFDRNGRHYTVDAWTYKLYTWFMVSLFFLRKPYISVRRAMGRIRRAWRRNQNK